MTSGKNPQKNFQVVSSGSAGELKKLFEAEVKGNIYTMEGHKVMMPPLGPENGGRASLNISHRFLVFQILASPGDQFQIELAIKDKGSVRFSNFSPAKDSCSRVEPRK